MGSRESDDSVVNVFNAEVQFHDGEWRVVSLIDGQRKVLSRHATREAAELAYAALNESGTRGSRSRDD